MPDSQRLSPASEAARRPAGSGLSTARTLLLVAFFAVPAAGGLLSLFEVAMDGVVTEGLDGARGVAVSPSGDQVYATGNLDDALVVFLRDASADDASLDPRQILVDSVNGVFGLDGARGVAASPDGKHVYVTAEIDDSLTVFTRDASGDVLRYTNILSNNIGGVFGLDGAASVAVSPDGYHVFVAGQMDDSLAVFSRTATTDDLQFVDLEQNMVAGVNGLDGAASVAVSPLGDRVYVASRSDNALAVFERDGTADDLTFLGSFFDGFDGVDGLARASSVAVSPDGRHVYVTGRVDDSVAVFERSFEEGFGLTFVDAYTDGVDGVDGLNGAEAVALSPSGSLVFVAGDIDDGIAVFRRQGDGRLDFVEAIAPGPASGLDGPVALAVAPDALHVYAAARDGDSIVGFRLLETVFYDGFESGDKDAWSSEFP
ncbi:MAG: beta-propeller fold lactonase family protein [Acidobacteriota bacterium]